MKKNKKFNNQPSQGEMKEIESLYSLNQLNPNLTYSEFVITNATQHSLIIKIKNIF